MKTAEDFLVRHVGTMVLQLATLQAAKAEQDDTLSSLYECVVSGQVNEAGIAALMRDPLFRAYYERRAQAKGRA